MQRTFNFEIVTDDKGYKYYEIPANTLLFRGDTSIYPMFQLPKTPTFFSTEPKFVKHYGIIFRFITTSPLRLLILDNHADYKNFYDNSPKDIQTILRRQYGYISGLRDSAYISDFKLVNYICSLGMDGYANDRMHVDDFAVVDEYEGEEDMENRPFHPELALCNLTKISFVNPQQDVQNYINTYGEEELQKAVIKKNQDKNKWEEKNRRENSRRGNFSGKVNVPFNNTLFGSPEKKDISSQLDELTSSDDNDDDESVIYSIGPIRNNPFDSSTSNNTSDDESLSSSESAQSSPLSSSQSKHEYNSIIQGMTLFQSPPKKQRRGGKKTTKKRKHSRKKLRKNIISKKRTLRKKYIRKGTKKSKKSKNNKKY